MRKLSKMRRNGLIALTVLFVLGAAACVYMLIPTGGSFSGRANWLWGVNGHNRAYASYPESELDEQLDYAAGLGCNIYRFNFNPRTEDDFAYLDKVVEGCEARELELLLVLDDRTTPDDEVYDLYYNTAKRYAGRIKYIQLFNELDVYSWYFGNGDEDWQYTKSKVNEVLPKLNEASRAVRDAAGDKIKLIVNFAWIHTGFLDILAQNDIDYDIVGWDWYSNADPELFTPTLDKLIADYGKDVLICEINEHPTVKDFSEKSQSDYIAESMRLSYDYPSDKLLGYIVYELYDQPEFEADGDYDAEAHFGLIKLSSSYAVTGCKQAYYTMKNAIGGAHRVPVAVTIASSAAWLVLCAAAAIAIIKFPDKKRAK